MHSQMRMTATNAVSTYVFEDFLHIRAFANKTCRKKEDSCMSQVNLLLHVSCQISYNEKVIQQCFSQRTLKLTLV